VELRTSRRGLITHLIHKPQDDLMHPFTRLIVKNNLLFWYDHYDIYIYDLLLQRQVATLKYCFSDDGGYARAFVLAGLIKLYRKYKKAFNAEELLAKSPGRLNCSIL